MFSDFQSADHMLERELKGRGMKMEEVKVKEEVEEEVTKEESASKRHRKLKGVLGKVVWFVAVVFSLYHIAYIGGLFRVLDIPIEVVHHRAIHLGLVLILLYLLVPASKTDKGRVPWYDLAFALVALIWNTYLFLRWEGIETQVTMLNVPFPILVTAAIHGVLVFEGTRRLFGLAMPTIAGLLVIYTMTASYSPSFLNAKSLPFERVVVHLGLWADGIYGNLLGMSATLVVMFIIFAQVLRVSGAGEFFIKLAFCVMGRFRGGPAKVAVLGSALFGTISGSAAANVASIGMITIPLMKRVGYKPHFAGGVEAVASIGGSLMPPVMGIVAFMMAEILGIPYWRICVYAAVPAILYYLTLLIMVDLEAAKNGLVGMSPKSIPKLGETLKEGWYFFIPLITLLLLLIVFQYSAQKSALYSIGVLVLVSQFKKKHRMGIKTILQGLADGGRAMIDVATVCAVAGVIIGCLNLTGLGVKLGNGVLELAGGHLLLILILTAIVSIIMGMGVTTVGVYLVLIILIAPALIAVGIRPIVAHMFVFWFGMSAMLTPPVAPTAYVAASIAGSDPWKTGWTATRLGIITYIVPFAFVYNPAIMMIGPWHEVLLACLTALMGSAALGFAVQGYFLFRVGWVQRVILFIGAIALIFANWKLDVLGIILIGLPIILQIKKRVKLRNVEPLLQGEG